MLLTHLKRKRQESKVSGLTLDSSLPSNGRPRSKNWGVARQMAVPFSVGTFNERTNDEMELELVDERGSWPREQTILVGRTM